MLGDTPDLVFSGDRPLSEQEPQPIADPPQPDRKFVPIYWTADASEIVGWLIDESEMIRAVVAYSLAGRTYREIVHGDTDLDAFPLRDPRRMIVERADKLWLLHVPSGRQEQLLSLEPELTAILFSVSRDERWIYFATTEADGDLWLAELD